MLRSLLDVTYRMWAPTSSRYAGVDAELCAVLGPISMAVRRPTIAALAALPDAIKAARASKHTAGDGGGGGDAAASGGRGAAGGGGNGVVTAVESGKTRVAVSVSARVDALRLVLLLDDAEDDGATPGPGQGLVDIFNMFHTLVP